MKKNGMRTFLCVLCMMLLLCIFARPALADIYASNVAVEQVGPDEIHLTWDASDAPAYYVLFGPDQPVFWHHTEKTRQNSAQLHGFAPGIPYRFVVLQSDDGTMPDGWSADNGVHHTTQATGNFTAQGYHIRSFRLFTANEGADFWNTKNAKPAIITRIRTDRMAQLGGGKRLYCVADYTWKRASKGSPADVLITLAMPDGQLLSTFFPLENVMPKDQSEWQYAFDLTDTLIDCRDDDGEYLPGAYIVTLYYNGQYVASTQLTVD